MAERDRSNTAIGVAMLRVAHQLFDSEPRILEDPVILGLFGPDAESKFREGESRAQTPGARALRAHVVLRSRYAEDRLAAAVARGVSQYVLLGAGLDTFAYRQPEWASELVITEVDHPASARDKHERVQAAGLAHPSNLRIAAIDFEKVSLRDGLESNGVDLARPVFFSWLGVTMYLTRDVVLATLRLMASLARGSEVVFTFAQRRDDQPLGEPRLAARAADVGEPWVTYFERAELEQSLRDVGFSEIEVVSPAHAARYFDGRDDELPAPRRESIVSAIV